MNKLKSKFEVQLVGKNFILITDDAVKEQTMSVTNDAENVVEYLTEYHELGNKRIFYEDTDGMVDELVHEKSTFTGFKMGYHDLEEFGKNMHKIKL